MTNPNPSQDNLAVVKSYTKSPLFLVRGVLHFLFAVCYAGFMISLFSLSKDFVMITSGVSNSLRTAQTAQTVQTAGIISSIFSTIPLLLIALGYILIWTKSRNDSPSSDPTSGVTILNVLGVLRMIGAVITSIILFIYSVVLIVVIKSESARSTASKTNTAKTIEDTMIPMMIFLALAAVAILLSAIANKRFLTTLKRSLKQPELRYKGAKTSGVLFLVSAVIYLPCIGYSIYMLTNYARIPFIIGETHGDSSDNVAWLLSISGGSVFTFLFLTMLTVLLIYLVSALLALGYFRHIEKINTPPAQPGFVPTEQPLYPYTYPASPDGGYPQQPPANDPYRQ